MSARFTLFSRYVSFAQRRTNVILVAVTTLALIACGFALRLELHTDMAELLPPNHPAVLALRRIEGRQKSASNLVMLVHSPSGEANRKFIEALRPKLDTLVPHLISEVQTKPDTDVPDFANKWKLLYAELKDLESAESLVDRLIAKRTSPLMVDLEGDPDEELHNLQLRLKKELPKRNDSPYFESRDEKSGEVYTGVRLWRRR